MIPGQRVFRATDAKVKTGTVIKKFSRPAKTIGDTTLGPYPELYRVLWDSGAVGVYLPHGVTALDNHNDQI